jgi:arylsulfatase A-like enzyme
MRKKYYHSLSGLFALLAMATIAAQQPNVIVILADDMGRDSISAFNDSLGFETPRIDALVKEGMVFSDGHSGSAVCTPTRYGLLTGRYSWRSRLKKFIIPKWDTPLIEEGRMTMASMLKAEGYDTAMIGKWHLGWNWPFKSKEAVPVGHTKALGELAKQGIDWAAPLTGGPLNCGFDYQFGDDVINWPPFVYIENEKVLGTPDSKTFKVPESEWSEDTVLPTITTKAVSYIEKQAKSDKPFFLYFPMTSPHSPIAPADQFKGISGISPYVDFIIETDHRIGQILDAVDRSGIAENTLIFFTADNGTSLRDSNKDDVENKGVDFEVNIRGGKSDIWEGGHRVPFIVRWPGTIQAGSRNDTPICLTDVMATVAEVVGVKLPDNAAEDSVSLLPALRGKPQEHGAIINHSVHGKFAIRKGPWKLAFCAGSGGWSSPKDNEAKKAKLPELQLYNLSTDPLETTNVIYENPELAKTLTKELHTLIKQGRSTPGAPQQNVGETWLPDL